jgi:hypothetical protein
MSQGVIIVGSIVLTILVLFALGWWALVFFRRHNPELAAASVTVAADVPFELPLPGSPGKLFFRYDNNEYIDGRAAANDLLVSGEIVDDHGGVRAFAVKTWDQSGIKGAHSARTAGVQLAASGDTLASISLAAVHTGDRVVRGVVHEGAKGTLRKGWVYLPHSRKMKVCPRFGGEDG